MLYKVSALQCDNCYNLCMTSNEAEQIIQDYGKVLELASSIGLAIPEQFLPHDKRKIREAFKFAYKATDNENRQLLVNSYMRLPVFVPIDDAIIVFRYTNWLSNKDKSKNIEDEELRDDWQLIMNRINKEMEEYMKELISLD